MIRANFTGWRPDRHDPRDVELDPKFLALADVPTPPKFNIYQNKMKCLKGTTITDIEHYTTHIFDQLETSTCVCNALASAYRCALERQGKSAAANFIPSRMFLYYVVRALEIRQSHHLLGEGTRNDLPYETKHTADWIRSLAANPPTEPIREDNGCEIRNACKVLCHLGTCEERAIDNQHTSPEDWWPFFYDFEQGPSPLATNGVEPQWWKDFNNFETETMSKDAKDTGIRRPDLESSLQQFKCADSLGRRVPKAEAFKRATHHHSLQFSRPLKDKDGNEDIAMWKKCIENGYPLVIAYSVYPGTKAQDEKFEKDYIAYDPEPDKDPNHPEYPVTGHVVLVVGWDDSKGPRGCFRIQDSYGADKFDGGFWWMPYSWLGLVAKNTGGDYMAGSPWLLLESIDD